MRETYRKGWAGLSGKDDAEAATEILCDLGWIRPIVEGVRAVGRPASPIFETNSKILNTHTPGTDKTDKTQTALELLREAERRGLRLKPAGDKLAVIPARRCTLAFAATLREHKCELLAFLANSSNVPKKVKPYRPLTEFEQDLLRRKGVENDPIIIEALNIFVGRIVE